MQRHKRCCHTGCLATPLSIMVTYKLVLWIVALPRLAVHYSWKLRELAARSTGPGRGVGLTQGPCYGRIALRRLPDHCLQYSVSKA